jgi:hypothetical protein
LQASRIDLLANFGAWHAWFLRRTKVPLQQSLSLVYFHSPEGE